MAGLTVVLDVGKTLSKLTLWTADGDCVARETRPNERGRAGDFLVLDTDGIETWLLATLARFADKGLIERIIPVGHGAAAAIVRDGRLAHPVTDYETALPAAGQADYAVGRDPFSITGSPALGGGLNLGAQFHALEATSPELLAPGATLLLWPQYWAWRLSGVAASEATSLGCHTDLWNPALGIASPMAVRRGWAALLPPLRRAADALGPILPDVAEKTGLAKDVVVHCGLHDSNAALVAARGFPEIAVGEATILSTGTWFVAMRSKGPEQEIVTEALPAGRDCLVNVDVEGRPIPSARFMGGREIETLSGIDTRRIDIKPDQPALVAAVPRVLEAGSMVLPTFAPGYGPFPAGQGRWLAKPEADAEIRAAVCLYAALVANVALDLIGSRKTLLVEGRFAEAEVFVRALAALRPDTGVYVAHAHNDVSFGALRLLNTRLMPGSSLVRVEPLDGDLAAYRATWATATRALEPQE